MNIYDTKLVRCTNCGKCLGEINYEATIGMAKCGYCTKTEEKEAQEFSSNYRFTVIAC